MAEMVDHPDHYNQHPSGVECIEIVEHMNFAIGSAFKYLNRAGLKADPVLQDLRKALWYLEHEEKYRRRWYPPPTVILNPAEQHRVTKYFNSETCQIQRLLWLYTTKSKFEYLIDATTLLKAEIKKIELKES